MRTLSATCLAIALANKNDSLRLVERACKRFGGTYVCLEDDHGLIEVQANMEDANLRIAALVKRAA
jgi:hypothetical protein